MQTCCVDERPWLSEWVFCILVFYSLCKNQLVNERVAFVFKCFSKRFKPFSAHCGAGLEFGSESDMWTLQGWILLLAWQKRCFFMNAHAHTLCSAALLRLLEVSSNTATNAPSPRPRERTRNIPLRLCGCTAKDLALSAMQLLAHHLLRR